MYPFVQKYFFHHEQSGVVHIQKIHNKTDCWSQFIQRFSEGFVTLIYFFGTVPDGKGNSAEQIDDSSK